MTQNPLSVFEAYLRGLIRDEVRTALPVDNQPSSTPIYRIGGIALAEEVTGMARQTIYNMVSKRLIPHSKRGGRIMFDEKVLREWLVENRRPTKNEGDDTLVLPRKSRKGGIR